MAERTLDNIEEDYLRDHPEEIDDYLTIVFEEYAKDGDTGAFLASLRTIGRVKGISDLARKTGLTRKGIQKALSEGGNPQFESVNSIIHAMGYQLIPQKLDIHST